MKSVRVKVNGGCWVAGNFDRRVSDGADMFVHVSALEALEEAGIHLLGLRQGLGE
jgi:hypothetical protein